MTRYLITSSHGPGECRRVLEEELAKGSAVLEKFVYGCRDGDHTGYAIVEAKSRSDALGLVPDFLQDNACVARVDKFTPAEVKSLHAKAA
jgi:hypothetical protein